MIPSTPPIEWSETNCNVRQEIVSKDGRWHISMLESAGKDDPSFYLANYDLLLSPHGIGKDYRECFEAFIRNCRGHIGKIQRAQEEAEAHLRRLLKNEQELLNEN